MRYQSALQVATALLAIVAAGTNATAQECKASVKTLDAGSLKVAVYNYPPFTTVVDDKNMGGVDSDVVKEIAKRNCLKVVPVVVDPSAVIQNVLTNKVDLGIGDWFRTAERDKVIGLSHPVYVDQMAFYSKAGVSKVDDLKGLRVGAVTGFLYAGQLKNILGESVTLYPNPVGLAQDLSAGRFDVAVDSYGTGIYAQSQGAYSGIQIKIAEPDTRVPLSVEPAQIALLYNKANTDLGQAVDKALVEMHKDGSIAAILKSNGLDESGADTGEPRLIK